MLFIRAESHKMLVRIANMEDPNQTASEEQSDLGLHCLSTGMPFWQAMPVQNFRKFTVPMRKICLALDKVKGFFKVRTGVAGWRPFFFTFNVLTSLC